MLAVAFAVALIFALLFSAGTWVLVAAIGEAIRLWRTMRMTETTWCTRHERLEPIAGVLDSDIGFAAGAYSAHVRLACGITKNIVTTARRLGHMAIEVQR